MAPSQVYTLIRTDYQDTLDGGSDTLISIHTSAQSAKRHMDRHVATINKKHNLQDPNSNHSDYKNGTYGVKVMVNQDAFHSYDIRTHLDHVMEDSDDEHGDIDDAVPHPTTSKTSKAKTNGAKKPAVKAKAPTKRKAPSPDPEDKDDDEEAMPDPPEGSSTALSGLSFLITGTLEGLTRDQAKDLIARHGGENMKALSKKEDGPRPDYIVLGVKPGPKKVEEFRKGGYTTINQDELYEMIETKKGAKRARR
ncbi:Replication factor C subunit 1 [Sphaceloma murrayae]|uniref:Replication factor C subunit 1 n=1 Tax=Sphaceloma murrayae TaxID=2082308 RepID=A0A2K1QRS0_9PEZI|nr:Replication factor C subunit 1 [Sphaceloma murrayae]